MEDSLTTTPSAAEMQDFDSSLYDQTEEDDVFVDPQVRLEHIRLASLSIYVFGLFMNMIVLRYFWIHRRNPFTIYLISLAFKDAIFFIPSFIVALTTHYILNRIIQLSYMFGFLSSQYLLTAISVDRCLSVWCPAWYRSRHHKLYTLIVCVAVLLLSIAMTSAWFAVCGYEYQGCRLFHLFLYEFLFFISLMLLSSLALLITFCWRHQRRRSPRRSILLLTKVFSFLFLAALPKLLFFMEVLLGNFAIVALCLFLNMSLNPIIYFLAGSCKKCPSNCSIQLALQTAFQDELDLPLQEETAPVQCQLLPACSALQSNN